MSYNHDLFSNDTTSYLLSDILAVNLYEPEHNCMLVPGALSSALQVRFLLKNEEDVKYFYKVQCTFQFL